MQAATEGVAYCGLIGAELMFTRLNVNGRQGTKLSLIYFSDATVKIDAPSLSNDISRDAFPIRFVTVTPVYFQKNKSPYISIYNESQSASSYKGVGQ